MHILDFRKDQVESNVFSRFLTHVYFPIKFKQQYNIANIAAKDSNHGTDETYSSNDCRD